MRRIAHLAVAVAAAAGLGVLPAGSANALGGEWLGCRISPPSSTYTGSYCETSQVANSYGVSFAVQNGSGAYTYAWTLNGQYQSPVGCTSTTYYCDVTVAITQGGQSLTLSAEAYFDAVCWDGSHNVWC